MKFKLSKDFSKSLRKLSGKDLKKALDMFEEIGKVSTISDISNCKKLVTYANVYRIRLGDRRAFFTFHIELIGDILFFRYLVPRGQAYDRNMEDKLRQVDKESSS